MDQQLTLHIKAFNKRIQVMNQTGSKDLLLSRVEAQNLHAEIFDLLGHIADLTERKQADSGTVSVQMDGGSF